MNVEIIQTIYTYHYHRFREIWGSLMTLNEAQFVQHVPYSHGSLRNHMVHIIDDDWGWVSLLAGKSRPQTLLPDDFETRDQVRAAYDEMEVYILDFMAHIDEPFLQQEFIWHPPFMPEPQRLNAWQILLHVVNHGTDHRAQLLRILHDFGAPTFDQDLMGYLVHSGQTKFS